MTAKKRARVPNITPAQIAALREEYINNPLATVEFLAAKYGRSSNRIGLILSNKVYPDSNYENPRKKGGTKRGVFLPDHIKEWKDQLTPAPNTAHRARGQNYVINKFS